MKPELNVANDSANVTISLGLGRLIPDLLFKINIDISTS